MVLEVLDDASDVLGAVAGTEEQGVVGFDEDEVVDTDGSDEFRGAPEIVAFGIEGEDRAGGNVGAGLLG